MQKKRWLAVVGICLSIFVILGFIKFMQIRAAIAFGESFPEPSETVTIQEVRYTAWQPDVSVIGEVRASRDLELRTEVGGVIAVIGFESGANVSAGDVLLQLDIAEERAQLSALEPQIELARKDVKRLRGIRDGAVSQQLIDQANSQLATAQAQATSVREIIANKTIVAPFDGRTGLHDFEVGEAISANELITRLVGNLDRLWVDFAVPQKFTDLEAGASITITAPEVFNDTLTADVIAVEPGISSSARSLRARAELDNRQRRLKPGMFVNVTVPLGDPQNVVLLPSAAVRVDSFGAFVFTVQKDDQGAWRAKRTPIDVITKRGFNSVVGSGLQVGDRVAATGSFKLNEGMLVNIAEQDSSPPAATPDVNASPSMAPALTSELDSEPIQPDAALETAPSTAGDASLDDLIRQADADIDANLEQIQDAGRGE